MSCFLDKNLNSKMKKSAKAAVSVGRGRNRCEKLALGSVVDVLPVNVCYEIHLGVAPSKIHNKI